MGIPAAYVEKIVRNSDDFRLPRTGRGRCGEKIYLELSEGETPTGTDAAVVLDSRASNNGPQLVDGPGSKSRSLGLPHLTTVDLLGGL